MARSGSAPLDPPTGADERGAAGPAWPIDLPMLLRFGLLAALATGSWLGGAVVERILSVWLS